MRLPHQALDWTLKRFEPAAGVITLVALAEAQVVSFAEMITYPDNPRHRHRLIG